MSVDDADILSLSDAGPAAVRGAGLRIGSFIAGALAGLGSAALLYRHLSVDQIGRYVTIISLVAIVAGLTDLGLTAVGIRWSANYGLDERQSFLADLLGLRIVLTVSGVGVMVAVTAFSAPAVVPIGVAIAGSGLLLQVVQDNYSILLAINLRLGWMAVLDLIRNVGTAVLIALLVVGGAGLLAFVSLAVPIGIVSLVVVARLVRGDRSLIPTFNASRWRSMIRAILPYSIAVAASTVYFRIAVVLTAILASAHASGLFNASFRMTEVLTAIPALVAGTGLPIFARAARDDLARLGYGLSRVFEVSLALGVWFALSIAIGAHLAFTLIGGLPKYAGAPRVLAVQGVALGGTFVSAVGAYGMLSLNLNRAILAVNAGALGGSIVLMAVLIPADGGQGAALAMAIGEITAAIVSFLVLGRRSPALRPPLRVMPRVALAAAVGASPVLIGGLPIIVRLVISSLLYLAVLLLTGALPRELVDALPGRVSAHLMPTRRERPHR